MAAAFSPLPSKAQRKEEDQRHSASRQGTLPETVFSCPSGVLLTFLGRSRPHDNLARPHKRECFRPPVLESGAKLGRDKNSEMSKSVPRLSVLPQLSVLMMHARCQMGGLGRQTLIVVPGWESHPTVQCSAVQCSAVLRTSLYKPVGTFAPSRDTGHGFVLARYSILHCRYLAP